MPNIDGEIFPHFHIFRIYAQRISRAIKDAEPAVRETFVQGLPKIAENFYIMPNKQDVLFDIAVVFYSIQRYAQAIHYYKQSVHYFGDTFAVLYNLGLCHHLANEMDEALASFKRALELKPESTEAKDWIKRIEDI